MKPLLLGGSDLLLNLHQYAAMLASAYFIFVILKKLGTGRLFCFFGVFVYLTMPLTMSQAITTQNDLGAALWYLIFLYYVLYFLDGAPLRAAIGKQNTNKRTTKNNSADKHTPNKLTTDKRTTQKKRYRQTYY